MKIPKLHSDELNEIVNDIASIDDSTVKMFKKLNDVVNARAKKACERIDGVISDIKEILEANKCYKMNIGLGNRTFTLHQSMEYVYISIVRVEDDEAILSWNPEGDPKMNDARNLKPISCKNDALTNLGKIQYLEDHAKRGEEIMRDFVSSYAAHVSEQQRKFASFIENSGLNLED